MSQTFDLALGFKLLESQFKINFEIKGKFLILSLPGIYFSPPM